MKSKISIFFLTIILLSGCIKDTLDRKPLNMVSDADVWLSEQLIDVYVVALYNAIPTGFSGLPFTANLTDESSYHEENPPVSNYGNHAHALNTGMYSWIRKVNYFIKRVETASVPMERITQYVAEARFIRAFYYFDLARKYGGMPIIEEVQTFDNNLEALQVARNTEEQLYDFILKELDAAIAGLPEKWDANNSNRATKLVAQALKSRVALYAGSIAKYGSVQLNGLVGIPASKAAAYFTASMNASKAVMESNTFGLYDKAYSPSGKSGDPVVNYQQIFIDKNNKEIIFQKAYAFPDKAHSWDNLNIPEGFTTNQGSAICPLLELVESYEYIDGTPGILDVAGKEFNSPDDLFRNKDPRFHASIFRSETPYIGRKVQIYRGIYDGTTLYQTESVPFPKDPSITQVGADGPYPTGNYTKTGFYIRKITNPGKAVVEPNYSDQNYIEIRYAEILLNFAEAALELGTNLAEALNAVNQVRDRAGIRTLIASELTMDRLRNERKVELAFEDKRFWDIRRWRIGTTLFQNTFMHGLYPYLKYTGGTSYKYIFEKMSGYPLDGGLSRVFEEKDYYSNLSGYISTNKNIINNPGW